MEVIYTKFIYAATLHYRTRLELVVASPTSVNLGNAPHPTISRRASGGSGADGNASVKGETPHHAFHFLMYGGRGVFADSDCGCCLSSRTLMAGWLLVMIPILLEDAQGCYHCTTNKVRQIRQCLAALTCWSRGSRHFEQNGMERHLLSCSCLGTTDTLMHSSKNSKVLCSRIYLYTSNGLRLQMPIRTILARVKLPYGFRSTMSTNSCREHKASLDNRNRGMIIQCRTDIDIVSPRALSPWSAGDEKYGASTRRPRRDEGIKIA